jgi:hypothetical protein
LTFGFPLSSSFLQREDRVSAWVKTVDVKKQAINRSIKRNRRFVVPWKLISRDAIIQPNVGYRTERSASVNALCLATATASAPRCGKLLRASSSRLIQR